METITTAHPLRTITLQFDRSKVAPKSETVTLRYYHEAHNRTWKRLKHVQQSRKPIPKYRYRIESIERLYDLASYRFNRLKRMDTDNPVRETVYTQLKDLLNEMDDHLDELVPRLVRKTEQFIRYEDDRITQDEWMEKVAFPQFHELISKHRDGSVNILFFDLDLESFRHELDFVKKQETLYLDEMDTLINDFTELSYHMENLLEEAFEFDNKLLD